MAESVIYALGNFLIMIILMVGEVLRAYLISRGREYEKRQKMSSFPQILLPRHALIAAKHRSFPSFLPQGLIIIGNLILLSLSVLFQ